MKFFLPITTLLLTLFTTFTTAKIHGFLAYGVLHAATDQLLLEVLTLGTSQTCTLPWTIFPASFAKAGGRAVFACSDDWYGTLVLKDNNLKIRIEYTDEGRRRTVEIGLGKKCVSNAPMCDWLEIWGRVDL